MSRAFGQRPSSLLDLDGEDPLLRYAVDETLFVRLRAFDAERGGQVGKTGESGRGGMPTYEELIEEAFDVDVPVIGPDGVSRYLTREQLDEEMARRAN